MILTCDNRDTNVYNIVNSSVLPAFCCCLLEYVLQMYIHSLRQPEWSGAPFLTAWVHTAVDNQKQQYAKIMQSL